MRSEPGTTVTRRVRKSMMKIFDLVGAHIEPPKTSEFPSGAHVGSTSVSVLCETSSSLPPLADTKYIEGLVPSTNALNAIRVRSGDQRGTTACKGAVVSCRRSVPSNLLRHKTSSGYVT